MLKARVAPLVGAMLVAAFVAGACSSSKSSSSAGTASATTVAAGGDKTAFCKDNATLDQKTVNTTSEATVLQALKDNITLIDDFGKNAPADIKAQADVLVNGSHAAITANSFSGVDQTAFTSAGNAVNAYCGQNSDGTPATTAAPSTPTSAY